MVGLCMSLRRFLLGRLEPEKGIRCKRKGMCKISQWENYKLSLG
jgi:hypothetical protein